ncbi:MAG: cell division protein FtsQ/DivIB [Lachnospiraceae bacterium]|jgi:hypothetical protein
MSREVQSSRSTSIISKIIKTALALILAAVFFLVFRTKTIEVTGNIHYSDEQIREYIETQTLSFNTLFMCVLNHNTVFEDNGFLESINVSLISPGEILVTVMEKDCAGYIYQDGKYCYFNVYGEVEVVAQNPEKPENYEVCYIPMIEGENISVSKAKTGASVSGINASTYVSMIEIGNFVTGKGNYPDKLIIDGDGNINVIIGDINAALGNSGDIEEKMIQLYAILPKTEGLKGVLHLEDFAKGDSRVVFDKE